MACLVRRFYSQLFLITLPSINLGLFLTHYSSIALLFYFHEFASRTDQSTVFKTKHHSCQPGNKSSTCKNGSSMFAIRCCHSFPFFYRNKKFTREGGPYYAFVVVLLRYPFRVDLHATGRYSLIEKDARDDAAYIGCRARSKCAQLEVSSSPPTTPF
ncbi:hypothetical protein PIB30_061161 [Stylosanthes scabra]|uniref:Uncharacterized protein n=1 Tax=Stylosanthes scabra TaxID=79078 RepID=A0ABU6XM34_9FABA|nr:hypothetical protein [Stylosanthes scabra]